MVVLSGLGMSQRILAEHDAHEVEALGEREVLPLPVGGVMVIGEAADVGTAGIEGAE
jgi:hypothetical protein